MKDAARSGGAVRGACGWSRRRGGRAGAGGDRRVRHHREAGSARRLGCAALWASAACPTDIFYGIPDVLGTARGRYASRRVLVVGSGHSALNALLDLATLAEQEPGTRIVWAIRRPGHRPAARRRRADQLEERGKLGSRVRTLLDQGRVELIAGFRIDRVAAAADGIVVSAGERSLPPVDEVIAATGFRPDWSILSEVRLDLDPAVESPRALAPAHRPERPQLRHGAAARRGGTETAGRQPVRHRDEELRASADLPHVDGIRAGEVGRERHRRRLGRPPAASSWCFPRLASAPPTRAGMPRAAAAERLHPSRWRWRLAASPARDRRRS